MKNVTKTCKLSLLLVALFSAGETSAQTLEITPYIDYIISDDLIIEDTEQEVSVDDVASVGLAIAWTESQLGQGQISISYGSYDYETNDAQTGDLVTGEFDLIYAHFSGVAHYRQPNYTTTVSIGLGGTYFSADGGDSSVYPSVTGALGTRYDLSQQLSLVTELRAYGTFAEDDSTVFCQSGVEGSSCFAQFDGSFWVDAGIRVGIAYRF